MVLPRPYSNRKSLSRVSKQQYYQQAVAAQHTQAAAAAANYHHYQQQQQQQQQTQALNSRRPSKRSSKPANKYAISLRDTAVIRYVRHREWAEFVVGTAPLPAPSDWTPPSLEDTIKQKEEELAQLRAEVDSNASGEELLNLSAKTKFYDSATTQLRASFPSSLGGVTTHNNNDASETELQDKFGLVAVRSAPVVRLSADQIGDLGLPVYKQSPPQEEVDAWIAKHQAKAKEAAAAAVESAQSASPVATVPSLAPVVTETPAAPTAAPVPVFVPAMQDPTSLLATAVAAATNGAITPTGAITSTSVVDPAAATEKSSFPAAPATISANGTSKSTETNISQY
ncbi:hypothetical protein D0Z03_001883 [Geotrichum reessii]|nr:hypothetical protein D0Z03_001883 [Galactomyces reessii]